MLTLLFKADGTGPVCERLRKQDAAHIRVVRDTQNVVPNDGLIVRWGSQRVVPGEVKRLNSPESVRNAKDKPKARNLLGELAPKTWTNVAEVQTPCVIRPRQHHGGLRFYVCRTGLEVRKAVRRLQRRGWYASELIQKAREFRVFVAQNRVVCVSERFPKNAQAIAWNLEAGGRLLNLDRKQWPVNVLNAAIEGTARLGLDWAAIDVCVSENGRTYVFEANTAPGLRNPYTLKQIAKVFTYADGHAALQPVKQNDKWQRLLHPALREKGDAL